MFKRFITIIFVFLISNPVFSDDFFNNGFFKDEECKAVSWNSKRISNNHVSVQGFISEPRKSVSIEVWRHDEMIGDTVTYSNHRGAFQVNIYTNRKSYRNPQVVITCG